MLIIMTGFKGMGSERVTSVRPGASKQPAAKKGAFPDFGERRFVAVALLNQALLSAADVDDALHELRRYGLDVLHEVRLPSAEHVLPNPDAAAFSGAVVAAVLMDVQPQLHGVTFDGFSNRRLARAMRALRERLGQQIDRADPLPVAKLMEGDAAWALASRLAPGGPEALQRRTQGELRRYDNGPCQQLLGSGDRSKVELIDWEGRWAIRKTYRQCALSRMHREVEILEGFGARCPKLAQLLGKGPNYIICEYVAEGSTLRNWTNVPRPMQLSKVRELAAFVRQCIAHGLDPVDLSPGTNLIWIGDDFRVIDCEFWRSCDPRTLPEHSACLSGVGHDSTEGPKAHWVRRPYPSRWIDFTCLGLHSFLYDPAWLQRLKRPFVFVRLLPAGIALAVRDRLRRAAAHIGGAIRGPGDRKHLQDGALTGP